MRPFLSLHLHVAQPLMVTRAPTSVLGLFNVHGSHPEMSAIQQQVQDLKTVSHSTRRVTYITDAVGLPMQYLQASIDMDNDEPPQLAIVRERLFDICMPHWELDARLAEINFEVIVPSTIPQLCIVSWPIRRF